MVCGGLNPPTPLKKIRCLALDDEPLALALLADNIRNVSALDLVRACDDPLEALEFLQRDEVDLLFLDVQMPGLSGTRLLRSLSAPPLTVFVTAYEQFALEGYDLNVVDYLLKPVEPARFGQAVLKAVQRLSRPTPTDAASDAFFVHADYSLVKIDRRHVLYTEGLKDYVKIYLEGQSRPVVTRITLKSLEAYLPPPRFVRTHRSYIVNFSRIESVKKNTLTVQGQPVPIGESYLENFLSLIDVPN